MKRNASAAIWGLAVVALLGLSATQVRAANLDKALLKNGDTVLQELAKQRMGKPLHVGVLPFRVKKGGRDATFASSPLATSITSRLESALLMLMNDNEQSVGILTDVTGTASRQGVGAWRTNQSAFQKLFTPTYPLPYGRKTARADVFLTGLISNTGDRSNTKVVIQSFNAKSWQAGKLVLTEIAKFDVPTDRALLRDLGYNFSLTPQARSWTPAKRDAVAVNQVAAEDNGMQQPMGVTQEHSPENIAGIRFEMFYNKEKQILLPLMQGGKAPLFQAPPIKPGAELALGLTRVADGDALLGAVVKLNGKSLWRMEEDASINCNRWIYAKESKDRQDIFQGFMTDVEGKNLLKFKVLTEEESVAKASELGERAGWIDVDVFISGPGNNGPGPTIENEMAISTRGVGKTGLKKTQPETLGELQKQLRKANNVKVSRKKGVPRSGGLVVFDAEPEEGGKLEKGTFPNPVRLAGASIRYYDKSGMSVSPD